MKKRKRRSHLTRLMETIEEEKYETSLDDCILWFRILNKEIFDSVLPPVGEFVIGRRRGSYAMYETVTGDAQCNKIYMNKSYRSKQFFVEVLCHEMVHHYQTIHNEPLGHGPSFLKWREKLNSKGLQLVRAYIT